MSTFKDFCDSSTPLNKYIVKELGLVKGAVACKVIYAANLPDGVCRMCQQRIADELGVNKSTVSRAITWLLKNSYINLIKKATDTEPAHLKPSAKLLDLIPVAECNPTVADRTPTVAECNPPVAECNQNKNTNKSPNKKTEEGAVRPPAVDAYRKIARRFPDKATWPLLEKVEDLAFWENVVQHYIACGWNKLNLKGMLEFYDRRELPAVNKQNGNNRNNGHNRIPSAATDKSTVERGRKLKEAFDARKA